MLFSPYSIILKTENTTYTKTRSNIYEKKTLLHCRSPACRMSCQLWQQSRRYCNHTGINHRCPGGCLGTDRAAYGFPDRHAGANRAAYEFPDCHTGADCAAYGFPDCHTGADRAAHRASCGYPAADRSRADPGHTIRRGGTDVF